MVVIADMRSACVTAVAVVVVHILHLVDEVLFRHIEKQDFGVILNLLEKSNHFEIFIKPNALIKQLFYGASLPLISLNMAVHNRDPQVRVFLQLFLQKVREGLAAFSCCIVETTPAHQARFVPFSIRRYHSPCAE